MSISDSIIEASRILSGKMDSLPVPPGVHMVYNPLDYAQQPWESYVHRFGNSPKRILFLGMNPGPWGMAQTGIPFGALPWVKDWMHITGLVNQPLTFHPRKPIEGFATKRVEPSGNRLWGLFGTRFPRAEDFFTDHFVLNFCPLVYMDEGGRNMTPDKFPRVERDRVYEPCTEFLVRCLESYQPEYIIGVGNFARDRAEEAVSRLNGEKTRIPVVGRIAHPSPANPQANKDWGGLATSELEKIGAW